MNCILRNIPILLIAIISMIIYVNTLENGFVYDDERTIMENSLLKNNDLLKLVQKEYLILANETSYRPMVTFTYLLDYRMFEFNPMGYHLTNIILHTFNGIFVYIFSALLMPGEYKIIAIKPFIVSLLFVTHPLLTEAVNAISFREDLLTSFFFIATLIVYITLRSKTPNKFLPFKLLYPLSCLLYFFALLSKEMALILPLIIFCYEWIYAKGKEEWFRSIRYNIGYIAITLFYIYLRFFYYFNPHDSAYHAWPMAQRLNTVPFLISSYLKLALFPVSLSAEYIIPAIKRFFFFSFIIPFILIVTSVCTAFRGKKEISFGIFFMLTVLIPVCNIIPIANPFAERYFYLPAVGFAIVSGSTIHYLLLKTRYIHIVILCFITIILNNSLAVVNRNKIWKNNYTLWSNAVAKMPNSNRAHYNLGVEYFKRKQFDKSVQQYQAAIRINPEDPISHNNLAVVFAEQGHIEKAKEEFQAALKLKNNYTSAYYNIGLIFFDQGDYNKAMDNFMSVIKLKPDDPGAHYYLGMIYLKQERFENAIQEFKNAIKLDPNFVEAQSALASTYYKQGSR